MKARITPIGDIVKNVFTQIDQKKTFSQEEVVKVWNDLVGQEGALHTKPISVKKEILVVSVDSSSWMHELSLRKRNLLKGLKRRLGKDRISQIQFKIGEMDK